MKNFFKQHNKLLTENKSKALYRADTLKHKRVNALIEAWTHSG